MCDKFCDVNAYGLRVAFVPIDDDPLVGKADTMDGSGGCVRVDIGKLYWDVPP